MRKIAPILCILVVVAMASTFATTTNFLKTKLHITVRNALGNLVEGAKVSVYTHKADYELSQNPIAVDSTDEKGVVVFSDLGEHVYFVDVEKGNANNDDAATETEMLKPGRINKVTIIISE